MAYSDETGKRIPFSLEAEQSVLGSILIEPESFNDIPNLLTADDFYLPEHTEIFLAMQDMFLQSRSIDPVTLSDMIIKRGAYKTEDEAKAYLRLVAEIVPSAANLVEYAQIVRDKSLLRSLIEICGEVSENAYNADTDATAVVGAAEQRIFALAQGNITRGFSHIRDVLLAAYDHLKTIEKEGISSQGTQTGFSGLDRTLIGMGDSDLVLVGARPGMGKTSFCLNIATSVARSSGKTVCVFSLEMSAEQLVTRMLSSEAQVDSKKLRRGDLSNDDWDKLAEATSVLSECDILIDDTTGLSITAMKAKLRRQKNLGLVVIDYLQLMQSDKKTENRVNEVSDITRNLKIMAKELNVPVIVCSQLSRSSEQNKDKRPMLSNLRESGSIEQDADIVLLIHREGYYDDSPENQNKAEIIIAKNRHGETGTVEMNFLGQFTKFFSVDNEHKEV